MYIVTERCTDGSELASLIVSKRKMSDELLSLGKMVGDQAGKLQKITKICKI